MTKRHEIGGVMVRKGLATLALLILAAAPAQAETAEGPASRIPTAAPADVPAPTEGTAADDAASAAPGTGTSAAERPAETKPANESGKKKRLVRKPKKPVIPARELFAAAKTPAPLKARAIGFYAKGCLAGAEPLPVDGPAWQAMRLSRNRNWGHPTLIALIERLALEARDFDGWPGLLVGDISQPRGGPMLSGHASHQIGLDADIWLTPMPDRRLTPEEREQIEATSMLAADGVSVDPKVWSPAHVQVIKRAASYKEVERVLVHPAIKQALCQAATGDRAWLAKVRPYWGHYYHFHVRIGCPKDSQGCVAQPPPSGDDGCGKEVADWLKRVAPRPQPQPSVTTAAKSGHAKPTITLDELPAECKVVLDSSPKPSGPGQPGALAAQH